MFFMFSAGNIIIWKCIFWVDIVIVWNCIILSKNGEQAQASDFNHVHVYVAIKCCIVV